MHSIVRFSDAVLIEVNDTFTKTLGYTRDEVLGKTPFELDFWISPERLHGYREQLETKGFVRDFEVELRAKDGSRRTVLLSSEVVDIDGGRYSLSAGVDITARKRAESELRVMNERLRQSEERFSKIFQTSPAWVVITRLRDGIFVAANEAFLRTTGFTEGEVVGRTSASLNLLVASDQREEFLRRVRERGSVREREFVLRAKDGQLRTALVSAELTDIDGEPHVQTVGLDITERKYAEEKLRESELQLRESEARFSSAFHASPLLMTIARLDDARFVEVNEAFVQLTGWDRAELIGHDSEELGLWVDLNERRRFFTQLKRDGVLRNFECQTLDRQGKVHTMHLSGQVIAINHEPHLLTFGLDISEQKRAEQALRESEARTRALYESISAAVVVHDETGFLQLNSASLKLFGTTRPEEILGKHPADFSAARQPDGEDSAVAAPRHVARALAEGTHRFEWLGRRLDGTEFPVEVTLTALELEGRTVIQAVILDLTDRKRAEAELQNALAKERELNQLKSDFVSLVSHEFRTPLEIIMSSADNLDRYHDRLPREKREQLLRTIHKSVRRMSGMMEEVLVLGRLEADRMTFKPARFDLHAFCQRICDEIESATGKRCPIHLRFGGALSGAIGDEGVLRHIFTNVLSNAVKYSPTDEPVDFIVEREGDDAVCRMVDHGCGIPEADQKRLFQAFHRGTNVRQIPGTGLGLLIVRRCVALHGGDIGFESIEGKGTTFTIRLPLFTPPARNPVEASNPAAWQDNP